MYNYYSNLKYGLAIDSGSGVGTRLILDLWHEVMGHILMMAMVLHTLHMHSLRLTAQYHAVVQCGLS